MRKNTYSSLFYLALLNESLQLLFQRGRFRIVFRRHGGQTVVGEQTGAAMWTANHRVAERATGPTAEKLADKRGRHENVSLIELKRWMRDKSN